MVPNGSIPRRFRNTSAIPATGRPGRRRSTPSSKSTISASTPPFTACAVSPPGLIHLDPNEPPPDRLPPSDGFYNGATIEFLQGVDTGQVRRISGYVGTGFIGKIYFSPPLPAQPADGDAFKIFTEPDDM